jgi:hypothetical protein
MGKKIAEGKVEIRDFEDKAIFLQLFKLPCLEEKVNECGSSEFPSELCLGCEYGFHVMDKSFVDSDFGVVRISVMSRVCWWWLRRAETPTWGVPRWR